MKDSHITYTLFSVLYLLFNLQQLHGVCIESGNTDHHIVLCTELNKYSSINIMNGTQETSQLPGNRESHRPDGGSYMPVQAESADAEKSKQTDIPLQSQLEQSQREKSALAKQNAVLTQEKQELSEQLNRLRLELAHVKSQSSSPQDTLSLHGTPHLPVDTRTTKDLQSVKNLQKLLTLIRQYKTRITKLHATITKQNEDIMTLKRHQKYSADPRRPLPASMDSSAGSHPGPSTNMNLTLSLASAQPGRGGYNAPDVDRYPPALRLAESTYANADEYLRRDHLPPQTLVNDSSKQSDDSKTSSTRKPPKPKPRSRTSFQTTSTSSPSIAVIDSNQTSDESFQIVDNTGPPHVYPPSQRVQQPTLGMISEHPHSPRSLSNVPRIVSNSSPNALSQNVIHVQTCDVCNNKFPHLTEREFLRHCLECADDAAEDEIGLSMPVITQETGHAYLKTCPVCQSEFGVEVLQEDYENHVQSHFIHEEPRLPDWETV